MARAPGFRDSLLKDPRELEDVMGRKISWRAAAGAAVSAAATIGSGAVAQSTQELEAKIEALEAAIDALRADMTEMEAVQSEDTRPVGARERTPPVPVAPAAETDGFRVGDTVIQFGGFIDLDVNVTDTSDGDIASDSIARDLYIPSATPVGGVGEEVPDTDFTAESTRFFFTTQSDRGEHTIKSRIELDFLGSGQGNELVTNSFAPRLRHAFFTFDNWLVGQTWSTFQNTSTIPDSASFLALSDGMVFLRQPMIRYTRGNWQFALENSTTRDLVENASNVADDGFIPDVVAKYTARGAWGNASFAGLARVLDDEMPDGDNETENESAFGWGVSAAGDVNLTDRWGVKFSATVGEGVGRYIGLAAIADARMDNDGDLDPIPVVGGLLALHGDVAPKTRFTIGYSGLFADAELGETESVQSAVAVLSYDIAPRTTVGAEVLYGRRAIDAAPGVDDEGDLSRLTVSARYAF